MDTLLLDRYETVKSLGSGGFGDTFLARDRQMPSQRLVVVKKLKPANANQNTSTDFITQLFEKEAAVLEELGNGSSQIPKLYSYFSDNDEFYLVQEYIEGQSLSEVAPIGGEQAKTILSSLLNTLKFIHSKGIIHRDIKPENIILRDKDKLPVLIDFGAVKETMGAVQLGSGSTVSSVVIGTRGFMAPEQSAGRSVFSTDLYALGLTMIFAMTKKLPVEFATSHLTGELDWQGDVQNLDQQLAKVIDQAIRMEPSRRYPTAEAMLNEISYHRQEKAKPAPDNNHDKGKTTAPTELLHPSTPQRPTEKFQSPPPPPPPPPTSPQPTPSGNKTLIAAGIIFFLAFLGLGSGFMFMNQVNQQAILKTLEAEKEKNQAEQKRLEAEKEKIEAEQKAIEAKNRQQEAETRLANQRAAEKSQTNSYSVSTPSAAISKEDATEVVRGWILAKGSAFGPSYDRGVVGQYLAGRAYDCNLKSINWLQDNGAYYTYGLQRIDSVKSFTASGNKATIAVQFTEDRTLYNANGGIDRNASKFGTVNMTYTLEMVGGTPKITYFRLPGC